jgi:NADH-quinone oxidoreductase subunit J
MTEVNLFILMFVISVAAAIMMLVSENAVHSALFLILNMGCIAFLFLMLDAPFLAMVQITVYAGAIMVLFLFVIMLLGAEKLGGRSPFPWVNPVTTVLALVFLVILGVVVLSSGISTFQPAAGNPQVRVADFAANSGVVDLQVSGVTIEEDIAFGDTLGYLAFPPGAYEFALVNAETDDVVMQHELVLVPGITGTVIFYNEGGEATAKLVPDDLTAVEDENSRVTIFNAFDQVAAISVVDFGSDFNDEDTQIILGDIPLGQLVGPLVIPENTDLRNWAVIEAGNDNNVLARLSAETSGIEAGNATLLVVGADTRLEDTVRALAAPLAVIAPATFGSPTNVGQLLFSRYMLPMQMVSVLLLVAMVGAIVLTHRPKVAAELVRARLGRRRVSRPLTSVIASQVGHDISQPSTAEQLPESTEETASS